MELLSFALLSTAVGILLLENRNLHIRIKQKHYLIEDESLMRELEIVKTQALTLRTMLQMVLNARVGTVFISRLKCLPIEEIEGAIAATQYLMKETRNIKNDH